MSIVARRACLFLLLTACPTSPQAASPDVAMFRRADTSWQTRFDFDGDKVPDPISVGFSGGAHCCYTLSVGLSKTHRAVTLPFPLDGGYVGGLDLSRRANFDVEVGPDGVATMRMLIAKYGADDDPIPLEWVRAYGIHSHAIRIDLRTGIIRVTNGRE